uniref:Uncharacterized protein n=1 Tax=viral metagenome TaxID=1070528 RepID=A0A6M3L3V0_9ZZZZ
MARNTATFLELKQLFNQSIGDDLEFDTTTNITTNNSIISTTLNQFDDGEDDHFNTWWVYITEGVNITKSRKISNYATSGGTLTVYGAALAAETAAVTCRLTRYNPTHAKQALIRACEEIYPTLFKNIDDQTLITGNHLPDGSFEWWSSATAHEFAATSNATLAKTTTAGLIRGQQGTTSMKVTASAAGGYAYIGGGEWNHLLGLMDKTVSLYCWAYPEVTDDATIEIQTTQTDATTQTLTSSTACPAGHWTLLKLEDQVLNDDLSSIQIRFKVATNAKYVYFDDAYLSGGRLEEYLLPEGFTDGHLSRVIMQTTGYADPIAYDLYQFRDQYKDPELKFDIIDDGTYAFLKLLDGAPPNDRRLRLLGFKPLETLSADADPLTLDAHRIPLLIAKAREIFFEREAVPVSAEDTDRFQVEYTKASRDFYRLFYRLRMPKPVELIKV